LTIGLILPGLIAVCWSYIEYTADRLDRIRGWLPERPVGSKLPAVADLQHPDLVVTKGNDGPPVADAVLVPGTVVDVPPASLGVGTSSGLFDSAGARAPSRPRGSSRTSDRRRVSSGDISVDDASCLVLAVRLGATPATRMLGSQPMCRRRRPG